MKRPKSKPGRNSPKTPKLESSQESMTGEDVQSEGRTRLNFDTLPEEIIYDTISMYIKNQWMEDIAKQLNQTYPMYSIFRQSVVNIIQQAFKRGYVILDPPPPSRLEERLGEILPQSIKVKVIAGRAEGFSHWAGTKLLEWILKWNADNPNRQKFLLVGGGSSIRLALNSFGQLLDEHVARRKEQKPNIRICNATAGIAADHVLDEASFISCSLMSATGIEGGTISLASAPSSGEQELRDNILSPNSRCLVITGVGSEGTACYQTLQTVYKGAIPAEILFHPLGNDGENLLENYQYQETTGRLLVIEPPEPSNEKLKSSRLSNGYTLATLFSLNSLRKRKNGMKIIAVVTSGQRSLTSKAKAVTIIARNELIDYLIISSSVAQEIVKQFI